MSFYRRHLPHWLPADKLVFVTWRLHGSQPSGAGPRPAIPQTNPQTDGQRFVTLDRLLDHAPGPTWLRNPKVADAVVETLFLAADRWTLCDLYSWVIMSNHVHILILPSKPLREVTRAIKSTSARLANQILGRAGQPFWQDESFDHWVRNEAEFHKITRYIEMNPVNPGLVSQPEDWPWSSAHPRFRRTELGRSGTCPT